LNTKVAKEAKGSVRRFFASLATFVFKMNREVVSDRILYLTRANMRCTTVILVRRSPSLSTRTDEDVRPTTCLSSPRAKYMFSTVDAVDGNLTRTGRIAATDQTGCQAIRVQDRSEAQNLLGGELSENAERHTPSLTRRITGGRLSANAHHLKTAS
jgi:hypothetical protein